MRVSEIIRTENSAKRQRTGGRLSRLLLTLTAALQILVPLIFTHICYMETDDYLLNYIANGSYGAEGSAHLVYIRILLGKALQILYRLLPQVNWYLVVLAGFLILSLSVFYILIWENTGRLSLLAPALLWGFLIVPFFFTYTLAAFLAVGAGLALTASLFAKSCRPAAWIPAVGLVVAGAQLRWDTLLIAGGLMLPLLAAGFLRGCLKTDGEEGTSGGTAEKMSAMRNLSVLLVMGLLLAGSLAAERRAYSDPAWAAYKEYTFARSSVVDHYFSMDGSSLEAYAREGLSGIDCTMLSGWRFCEKPVFTSERLRAVGRISASAVTPAVRNSYLRTLFSWRNLCLLLSVPLMLLLALCGRGGTGSCRPRGEGLRRSPVSWVRAHAAGLVGMAGVLIWLTALFGLSWVRMRFVARVTLPVTLLAFFAAALTAGISRDEDSGAREVRKGRAGRYAAVLLAAAVMLVSILYTALFASETAVKRSLDKKEAKQALLTRIREDSDTLYIADPGVLNPLLYFGTDVKEVRKTDAFSNLVRAGSWDSFSPRYYEQVRRYLPDQDRLLTSLVTADNTAYLSYGDRDMKQFLEEQTGADFSGTSGEAWTVEEESVPGLATRIYRYHRG